MTRIHRGIISERSGCQKIEENNRKGKTRDLFKKIEDIEGAFCAKMDMIKVKNGTI